MYNKTLICKVCTDDRIENDQNIEIDIRIQEVGTSDSTNENTSETNSINKDQKFDDQVEEETEGENLEEVPNETRTGG